MNKQNCEQIQEMLVDYTDGISNAQQSAQIKDHLTHCQSCQAMLNALDQSLELTQLLWQDNDAQLANIKIEKTPRIHKWSYQRIAAIAATVLLVLASGLIWQLLSKPAPPPQEQPTIAQIEAAMLRAGGAAQLLAVADLIAKQPGGLPYAQERYTYLARAFPDLNTGTIAKQRLKNISERSSIQ